MLDLTPKELLIEEKATEVFDQLMDTRTITDVHIAVLAKLIASLMVEVEELKAAQGG